jgi:hypothetical protein
VRGVVTFLAEVGTHVYNILHVGREISQGQKGEETKDAAGSGSIPEETLLNIYWGGGGNEMRMGQTTTSHEIRSRILNPLHPPAQ